MVPGYHCLTLSLVVLPSVLLTTYFFVQFPRLPQNIQVYPSLASLPSSIRSWSIYPPDFYEGGEYVDLPHGRVRYWMFGPKTGKKIVFIHGFSIPSIIWKDVAPQLAARGFRVLLFDLYGRGYSDAPQTTYDTTLYTTQLALLMQHVRWDKAYVAGVSMGGGIATAFAAAFPDLVEDKVALICSAGLLDNGDISRTMRFMSTQPVQAVTSSSPFRFYLRHLANSSGDDPVAELVRIQSAYLPGYNSALASSVRSGPLRGLSSAFKALGRSQRKVLLIWGTGDNVVPYKYSALMKEALPNSELVTIDDGPHDLTLSHPKIVTEALFRFFDATSS